MMIAVQTIRATAQATISNSSAINPWVCPPSRFASSASHSKMRPVAYLYTTKRKRDSYEGYDYQGHMQKSRRNKFQEQSQFSQSYNYPPSSECKTYFPREVPREVSQEEYQEYKQLPQKYQKYEQTPLGDVAYPRRVSLEHIDDLQYATDQQVSRGTFSSSCSSSCNSFQSNRVVKVRKAACKVSKHAKSPNRSRMTRRYYSKKRHQEMMEATGKQLQSILASCNDRVEPPIRIVQRAKYYRRKAQALDRSLRPKCNIIVQMERDIKAWLGMTTSRKEKIMKLRSRLIGRWTEVKDLQSEIKPKRQRLKNLKFAVMCQELSIEEEPATENLD